MKRMLGLFLTVVIALGAFPFAPAFSAMAQEASDDGAIISTQMSATQPTIPAANIVINNNGVITNPYGKIGASCVRVDVSGVFDPVIDNKIVLIKGIAAKYTYYNGIYKFVALVDGGVTATDITVADGTPTRLIYLDVNANLTTEATDINLLKGAVAGNRTVANYFELIASDVNGDGFVNATDYNTSKGFIAGNLSVLPVVATPTATPAPTTPTPTPTATPTPTPTATPNITELNLVSREYIDFVSTTAASFSASFPELYYWLDPNNDTWSQRAQLSPTTVMFLNGVRVGSINVSANQMFAILSDMNNGHVKLVNSNATVDLLYDEIYVTTYLQGVVDTVDVTSQTITFKAGDLDYLSFNKNDLPTDFTYTLKDKTGANVDLTSIVENDVLAVAFSDNASQAEGSKYMDVIVLKDQVVGTITEIYSMIGEYKIGDKYYRESLSNSVGLKLGDSTTFCLDIDGKIIYKIVPPISPNYAYLVSASSGSTGGLDDNYELRIFTKEGNNKIVELASSVRVFYDSENSITYSKTGYSGRNTRDLANFLIEYTKASPNLSAIGATSVYANAGSWVRPAIDKLMALRAISANDLVASKIVSITTDIDGNVTKIVFPNVNITGGMVSIARDEQNFTLSGDVNYAYKASTKSFGNRYKLTDSTKVFYIPGNAQTDYDNFELRTTTSFTNDKNYNVALFDLDNDSNIGLVLLTEDSGFSAYDSRLSVVDRLGVARDADGNDVDIITVTTADGKYTSYQVSSKGYKVYNLGTVYPVGSDIMDISLRVGDAIHYTVNGSGCINNIAKVFSIQEQKLMSNNTNGVNDDSTYLFAKVYSSLTTIQIDPYGLILNKAQPSDMRYYEFNQTIPRNDPVLFITSSGIRKYGPTEKYFIVARMYSAQAFDVIQYRFVDDTAATMNIDVSQG